MKNYAIDNNIRDKVNRLIFIFSLIFASFIMITFNILVSDIAVTNVWIIYLNILILPSLGGIDAFLKWVFDTKLWKTKVFMKLLNLPNLNGIWNIKGENSLGYTYNGLIKIYQTFNKISIKGLFDNSQSENFETFMSISVNEIKLSYNYTNEPKKKEGTMGIHHGFAIIRFDKDLKNGTAKYFNDDFRGTQGVWSLSLANIISRD